MVYVLSKCAIVSETTNVLFYENRKKYFAHYHFYELLKAPCIHLCTQYMSVYSIGPCTLICPKRLIIHPVDC